MSLTLKQKKVYEFISQYVRANGVSPTQMEIKEYFGFKSLGSVQDYIKYLTNAGFIKNDSGSVRGLETIEEASTSDFLVPLLGNVAAGAPIEAIEGNEQIEIPASMCSGSEIFALRVKGNSMIEDGILDGDTVLIRSKKSANNGEVVVATINNEATLKRFFKKNGRIELHPANGQLRPIFPSPENFELRGVLVGLIRSYR